MEHLQKVILAEVDRCVHCGSCRAVCPVFSETLAEQTSARGKLQVLGSVLHDMLGQERSAIHRLEACLLCGRCTEECDAGVDPRKAIRAARELLKNRNGLDRLSRTIYERILPDPELMARGLRLGKTFQSLAGKRIPETSGLIYRFARPKSLAHRRIPSISDKFFIEEPTEADADGPSKGLVNLFCGCVHNYVAPEVSHATARVLAALGFDVRVPRDQCCCGLAAYGAGDARGAREMAGRNLDALLHGNPKWIVTNCGSCGAMLKNEILEIFPEGDPDRARAEALSSKIIDVLDLADREAEPGFWKRSGGSRVVPVTYHDSCHLRLSMRVYEQPRRLLRAALGEGYVEMPGADLCCGSGGAFQLHNPELSDAIAARKLDGIRKAGAKAVAAACGGCLLQLMDLTKHNPGLVVDHPIRWLDPAS